MSKIRVFELAKELSTGNTKVSSKEIVEKALELGISVENHLSQLDETEAIRLKRAFLAAQESESGQLTRVRRTVVRRRRAGGDEEPAEAAPTAAETAPEPAAAEPEEEEVQAPEPQSGAPEPTEEPSAPPTEALAQEMPVIEPEVEPAAETEAPSEPVAPPPMVAEEVPDGGEESSTPDGEEAPAAESPDATPGATPLVPTRRKKPREGFKAVVVAMPTEVEPPPPAAPPKLPSRLQPSMRELEKEDRASQPRKKGKRLIYDRRREPGAGPDGTGRLGKTRRKKAAKKRGDIDMPATSALPKSIQVPESISVSELASQMAIKSNLLLRRLFEQGIMATINDMLDYETAAIIAADLGYEVQSTAFDISQYLEVEPDTDEELLPRPPVVTIMGHVDHGKTSLLDRIQKSDIAAGEAGGITQTIGAYVVSVAKGKVVFIDTPGHEAFTAMRARGALVTDLVILVVAADDGVMPQTLEALSHARAANVPIIVAVNKVDKPESDPQRVRRELAEHDLLCEDWGGSTIFVNLSAKTGEGVDDLLEMLVLQSEVLELKANPRKRAKGIVIESRLEKGRGPVATVVIQEGTLSVGDVVVAGTASGRVRALLDDKGKNLLKVGPSFPAEIIGLDRVPPASEAMYVVKDEKSAKLVCDHLGKKERDERLARVRKPTVDELFSQMGEVEAKVLKVVLKGDSQGSVEAIHQGLLALSTQRVTLDIIHEGVGVISENDVNLAMASEGVIFGFNVKPDAMAKSVGDSQGIRILSFNLIHELVDAARALMEGKLEMIEKENYLGKAEIRQVFNISRVGKIAGCFVIDGKVVRAAFVRVLRAGELLHTGKLSSLKRFKDDVREVAAGFECGMSVDHFDDIREGDIIESFEIEKVAAKL